MSKQLKLRRGTTVEHSTFTGAEGEVTIDTSKDTLVVHDGATVGGHVLAKEVFSVQKDSDTGAMYIPYGTSAQRPVTPATGYMRFNTDLGKAEVWNGSLWSSVGSGATGGGADTVFVETSYTVTSNYTITEGKSAITIGDANGNVTIADGVDITIPDGSIWVIQGS